MTDRQFIILKTGSKIPELADFPGDYEEWIAERLGPLALPLAVVDAQQDQLPPIGDVAAVVITGSASMVTDASPWIEAVSSWLRELALAEVPILGICFGHQLLAHALGGEVAYNPVGVEVGTVEITLTDAAGVDPMFGDLPLRFSAHVAHRQSVVALPPATRLLARSERDGVQAFAWGKRVWGIQFHPEFPRDVVAAYVESYHALLVDEGLDPEALVAAIGETSESTEMLRRFAQLAVRSV